MSAPLLSHLVPTQPGKRLTVDQTINVINEEVSITPRSQRVNGDVNNSAPAVPTAYLATSEWGWEELRNYVIDSHQKIFGPTPRQPEFKEKAIFTGFINRHGAQRAAQIARYAFEVAGGYWKNAPISVMRFCANSDPYFSIPILREIQNVENYQSVNQA